jgi:hypothetical protein
VLFLEFTDGHEYTNEVIKYLDQPMRNFLDDIDKTKILDQETVLFWISDHGLHKNMFVNYVGDPLVYQVERFLPINIMLFSKDLYDKIGNNTRSILKKNS